MARRYKWLLRSVEMTEQSCAKSSGQRSIHGELEEVLFMCGACRELECSNGVSCEYVGLSVGHTVERWIEGA